MVAYLGVTHQRFTLVALTVLVSCTAGCNRASRPASEKPGHGPPGAPAQPQGKEGFGGTVIRLTNRTEKAMTFSVEARLTGGGIERLSGSRKAGPDEVVTFSTEYKVAGASPEAVRFPVFVTATPEEGGNTLLFGKRGMFRGKVGGYRYLGLFGECKEEQGDDGLIRHNIFIKVGSAKSEPEDDEVGNKL